MHFTLSACPRVIVVLMEMPGSLDSMASLVAQGNQADQGLKETLDYEDKLDPMETRGPREKQEVPETQVLEVDVEIQVMPVPREVVERMEIQEHPEMMGLWASREHREPRDRREKLVLRCVMGRED